MDRQALGARQAPLTDSYRVDPDTAVVTLSSRGTLSGEEIVCSVGFREIRLRFELESDASQEQLDSLIRLTERYCVVLQTIVGDAPVSLSAA
jgi:uncharacterized OsmC-like protein